MNQTILNKVLPTRPAEIREKKYGCAHHKYYLKRAQIPHHYKLLPQEGLLMSDSKAFTHNHSTQQIPLTPERAYQHTQIGLHTKNTRTHPSHTHQIQATTTQMG